MAAEESTTTTISNILKLPEELFGEIMLRCNLPTVYKCKCVSRDWNRILSTPSFRLAYISRHQSPLLGFFHFNRKEMNSGFSFLPTTILQDGEGDESLHSLEFFHEIVGGHFLCVSNGLVLCGNNPNLNVFNPITRQIFNLPRTDIIPQKFSFLAGSPSLVSSQLHHGVKVIVPFYKTGIHYDKTRFNVYCSQNRLWTISTPSAAASFRIVENLLSFSFYGTCFWFAARVHVINTKRGPRKGQRFQKRAVPYPTGRHNEHVVAYNPERDDRSVQLIDLPSSGKPYQIPSLCQSHDGRLQCVTKDSRFPGFRVYSLPRTLASYGYDAVIDHNEWVLAHNVKLDMKDPVWVRPREVRSYPPNYRFVLQEGFHPINPRILYLRRGTRIFSCDVENLEMHEISYGGKLYSDDTRIVLCPFVQLPPPAFPA